MIEYSEDHRLHVSGEISYRDVEAYLDGTVYLSIAAPRQVLQTGVSFARGSYWIEPIRPSVHLTGCDLEYLDDERVVGSYRPSSLRRHSLGRGAYRVRRRPFDRDDAGRRRRCWASAIRSISAWRSGPARPAG